MPENVSKNIAQHRPPETLNPKPDTLNPKPHKATWLPDVLPGQGSFSAPKRAPPSSSKAVDSSRRSLCTPPGAPPSSMRRWRRGATPIRAETSTVVPYRSKAGKSSHLSLAKRLFGYWIRLLSNVMHEFVAGVPKNLTDLKQRCLSPWLSYVCLLFSKCHTGWAFRVWGLGF